MENFNATRYKLQNVATKRIFEDEGWTLDDTQSSHPSLIRAVYESQQIHPHGEEHGIYRFAEWLPVKRMLAGSCAPVTYKSKGLAQKLGLKNLYITFNGYFPEIGARMSTSTLSLWLPFSLPQTEYASVSLNEQVDIRAPISGK